MSDVFESLVEAICDVTDLDASEVTASSNVKEDLGVDSIDFLDVTFDLDQKYKIKIPVEQWMEEINSGEKTADDYFVISALVENIEKLISEKAAA